MRLGPVAENQLEEVETLLKQKGILYSMVYSEGIQIDVAEKDRVRLEECLKKYGLSQLAMSEYDFIEQGGYHCLQCDYASSSRGVCPSHKTQLVSFGEWIEARRFTVGRTQANLIRLALVIIAGTWIIAYLSRAAS